MHRTNKKCVLFKNELNINLNYFKLSKQTPPPRSLCCVRSARDLSSPLFLICFSISALLKIYICFTISKNKISKIVHTLKKLINKNNQKFMCIYKADEINGLLII